MNERIRELAEQATIKSVSENFTGEKFKIVTPSKEWAEKFAELIVQECVRYFNEDYQRDFDTRWREDLSKGIKNHFGVES